MVDTGCGMVHAYIDDGGRLESGPIPGRTQTIDGPERRIDPPHQIFVVLPIQILVLREILEEILVRAVGDVEGRGRGRVGAVAPEHQGLGDLHQDIAQELGAKVADVAEVRIARQSGRCCRMREETGCVLAEEAIADGVADDASEKILREARSAGKVGDGNGRAKGHVLRDFKPGDHFQVRRVCGLCSSR
ncbi:hypothetical protein VTN77DRAFT_7885 [Rasamsonia byssochlamydoides]|uniref:uncharacterized protein n=1 Tax=Rasamsonia byssochlamydoides TaxID=89139 RepID=UPI003744527A